MGKDLTFSAHQYSIYPIGVPPINFCAEVVSVILVQSQYCPQNHRCPTLRVCPSGALQQEGYNAPVIDAEVCTECGNCVASCRVFKEVPSAATENNGHQDGKNGSSGGGILEKPSGRLEV